MLTDMQLEAAAGGAGGQGGTAVHPLPAFPLHPSLLRVTSHFVWLKLGASVSLSVKWE